MTTHGLNSPREQQLIGLSKAFERAFMYRDLSRLDELFAKNVTVHADGVSFQSTACVQTI